MFPVVTGCTDGIGKAYAEQLSEIGLNIILISRNPQKLEHQAQHLGEPFKYWQTLCKCILEEAVESK